VISLLPFINRNMNAMFAVLSKGPNYDEMGGYNTLEQAWDDGALVLAYGSVHQFRILSSWIGILPEKFQQLIG
jgi:large conductance mechanosensitive channel